MSNFIDSRNGVTDGLVSYPGHSLFGEYSATEIQSAYSVVQEVWAFLCYKDSRDEIFLLSRLAKKKKKKNLTFF